jgi:hypothetical protein
MAEIASSQLLTIDEIRALRRVSRLSVPRFVAEGDVMDVRTDAVALRGLAARGLVTFVEQGDEPRVEWTPALTALLTHCVRPDFVAQVTVESGAAKPAATGSERVVTEHAVLATTHLGPGATWFTAHPHHLVRCTQHTGDLDALLRHLCRLDELAPPQGLSLSVDLRRYLRADDLLAAGSPDTAVDVLVDAGAELGTAHAWIQALAHRRFSVAVSIAGTVDGSPKGDGAPDAGTAACTDRNSPRAETSPYDDPGSLDRTPSRQPVVRSEACWVVGEDGIAWRVLSVESASGDWDAPADPELDRVKVEQVDAETLGAGFLGLLVPPAGQHTSNAPTGAASRTCDPTPRAVA